MWFYYSLFYAIWTGFEIVIQKKLVKDINILTLFFLNSIVVLPFSLILILLTGGFPALGSLFFPMVFLTTPLDMLAYLLFLYAIRKAPISLLEPLSAFNPVFVTLGAFLFLSEIPSLTKLFGIIIVVVGAYLLDLSSLKLGIFKPITVLVKNRAAQLYFFSIIIWSITPLFQKIAIISTFPQSPLFPNFVETALNVIILLPFVYKDLIRNKKSIQKNALLLLLFGVITPIALYGAFTAFSLTNLGYSTAIFKLSAVFTVLLGGIFFKEKHIKERLLGAVIMIIGALLLAL